VQSTLGFFRPPDWDAPLDTEERLKAVPADGVTRGWVLQSVLDAARREGVELPGKASYGRFRDYPLREYVELLVSASELVRPEQPPRRTLFELGRGVFPGFASTLTGRVALRALGGIAEPARAGIELMSRLYRVTSKGRSAAELLEMGDSFAVIRLTGVWTFPDSYHLGVFVGAGQGVFGLEPSILVRTTSLCDCELLLSWTAPEEGLKPKLPDPPRGRARDVLR
jgi:uncharacterized protein (TIGR02265 family)